MKRTFLLRDADGKNVDVEARLENSGNRLAHFSITSQNGCDHETILASAPADVADDLAALVSVHLMDEESVPMHARANAIHHMREGDFPAAHRSLNGAGTIEDLYRINGEASTRFVTETPDVLARVQAEVSELASKAVRHQGRIKAANDRQRMGESVFAFTKRDAEGRDAALAEIAKLTGTRAAPSVPEAEALSGSLSGEAKARVTKAFQNACFGEAMDRHIEAVCLPAWKAAADRAREALSKPDYRSEGRPAIAEDDTTFTGFANATGLTLAFEEDRFRKEPGWGKDARFYTWTLSSGEGVMRGRFGKGPGAGKGLTVEDLLESLQSDFSLGETHDLEGFISEMGYDKEGPNGESVRKHIKAGEVAYESIMSAKDDFVGAFGEDAYRTLMTRVGDSPPLTEDFFTRSPSPGM